MSESKNNTYNDILMSSVISSIDDTSEKTPSIELSWRPYHTASILGRELIDGHYADNHLKF